MDRMRFMGVPENGPFETPKRTLKNWESYDFWHTDFWQPIFTQHQLQLQLGLSQDQVDPCPSHWGKIMVFPMSLPMRTPICWCPRVGWFCIQDLMTPLQVNPYPTTIPRVSQDYSSLKPHNTPQRWIGRLILQFFFGHGKSSPATGSLTQRAPVTWREISSRPEGSWGYFQLVVIDPIRWDIVDSPVTIIMNYIST